MHARCSIRATVHEHMSTSRVFVMSCLWYELRLIIGTLCISLYVRCTVYAVVARRTFISVALCSHLPQNVNDPDSSSTFFPHSPQTSKSKEKGKDVVLVCMCACYQSLRASVHLLQSYGPYRTRPRLSSLPLAFLRLWPPRQATTNYRAPTKGAIVFMGALSAENPGRSPSSLWVS